MATPILPIATPVQPLGLTGETLQPVPNIEAVQKEINPNARELLAAQDPMAQFEKVTDNFVDAGGAKKIDMNAREKLGGFPNPLAQFEKAEVPSLPGFEKADDLDVKTPAQLFADKFPSADYFSSNPDVARDPKKLAKLLEVYRLQDEEGLTARGVAEAAIKHGPGVAKDIAGGAVRLGERAIGLTVQPISNVVLGALTGDLFDEQKRNALFNQTRKDIKTNLAEVSAGSEAATVGLVDLARTGAAKIPYTGTEFEPIPLPTKKTDQELLRQIADDAAFKKVAGDAATGEGEFAKNLGLDKDTLAKQGVTLDPEAIRQLSLVDPITMVATGGAFKLVGVGGKVLGVAKSLEGAKYIADKLAGAAKFAAGKSIQGIGKAAEVTGIVAKGTGTGAATIAGVATAASGGGITPALIVGATTKLAGPALRQGGKMLQHAGKAIAGEVPVSANLQRVLDYAAVPARAGQEITKGAFQGMVAGAPFALAAKDDETAGTLLGAGAALGAAHAAGAGALRVVKSSAARRFFDENRSTLPDVASPAYGTDAALDATHAANVTKLSVQDASEVNNFREALRPQGGEIYVVDAPTWRQKIADAHPGITPEQLDIYQNHSAFFDKAVGPDRKVVYLNGDATGLKHDAGHIFDALLTPEKRTELRAAVTEAFGQKAIDDFGANYERQVGNKIGSKAILDEFIAEQFNALFHNVPLEQLNAPRSLLSKFVDTAAEAGEALGIDLTDGRTTPSLNAPVAVGVRQMFRNAAGDVMKAKLSGETPPAAPATPPATPPPAPPAPSNVIPFPGTPPAAPAAPVTPPPNAPPPSAPSRNIRVQPEQVAAFKQSATPDVRAKAAARASETGIDAARASASKEPGSPMEKSVTTISDSMESGNPVVQIEHLGITSESTPEAALGRTPRRGEQASGYAALEAAQLDVRQNAPPEIVSQHSKNFVPVRWTDQGGTPTLIAMSLDKVIANILKVAADPKAKDLIPYDVQNGKLTPEGWRQVVADAQAYAENQANGRKGDGGRLEVPEAGLSIPAENPAYTPQTLSPERANFQNLVQGIAPPQTSRAQKGIMPGNVKGQILAEANLRPTSEPANISAARRGKQEFAEFPGRTVQETNPLRNEMEKAGVKTRELIEVTERIRAKDIVSAKSRPDVAYKAPVTDIIRGGFLPAPEEFRTKNLAGQTPDEYSKKIIALTPDQWKAETDAMAGGLTGGAWNLGLGLKDAADVAVLKTTGDSLSAAAKAAMQAGDFDGAYAIVTKGQFFREAYEAATGTGSAGAAFKRNAAGFGEAKPPFPAEGGAFLPEGAKKEAFKPETNEEIKAVATGYTKEAGIDYAPKGGYAEVKPDLARRLADFYEAAKSDPENAEVASSYNALSRETEAQGRAIIDAGYKIEAWEGKGEPYKNSAEAVADVRDNKHLFYRKTEDSFGSGKESANNPMLAESKAFPGQVINDVFRWVHDFFGHAKEGYQFGPRGEFNAWRSHSEMYSPEAQGALAGETLAQNSWVNFGRHLEGKNIPQAERPFATQKNVVIPKELITEAGFQPRTKSGEALEKKGFRIQAEGNLGIRKVTVLNDDGAVAVIQSVQRSPKRAEIAMVQKYKGAPKGVGEVMYRELASQLKEDGVTHVEGNVIAPEPLAIRKKVFGDFESIKVNDEPATLEQALDTAERVKNRTENEIAAIEPVSRISPESVFAPRKVKRDAQGRPLKKDGEIDYARWQREGIAARKERENAREDYASIAKVGPKVKANEPKSATGWVLPNKEFVPLDTNFHEQYLAENAADLNKKFGTEFDPEQSSGDDRLAALNAGFVRFRNYNGRMSVEANAANWGNVKRAVRNKLQDLEGHIDGLTVSLLNKEGQQVDSHTVSRMHEMDPGEKLGAIDDAVNKVRGGAGGSFLPGERGLPGFEERTPEETGRAEAAVRISSVKKNNPEAIVPQYVRDEDGKIVVQPNGKAKAVTLDYDFENSHVAKEAAKGLKGEARTKASQEAVGDELVKLYKKVEKNKDITAGATWYSTARTRLKKVFGDDAKFFAELLGATSARTPVDINFRFALDAYNQFKAGVYDNIVAKYREGKKMWEEGNLDEFVKATKATEPTRGAFLDWWVQKHDISPTQSNGKKFGMNSRAVLRVLDGSWASEVQGPKTPNFTGNLTGETFEATIDIWAARTLSRLANESSGKRWRILGENETGVTDNDFYFGQAAYAHAAKKLGLKPDALQAILWFAEKDHWEKKGWTRGAGAEKSDFNVLLNEIESAPTGELRMKAEKNELDFGADLRDISKKKK